MNVDVSVIIINYHDLAAAPDICRALHFWLLVDIGVDISWRLVPVRILLRHYSPMKVMRDLAAVGVILVVNGRVHGLVLLSHFLFLVKVYSLRGLDELGH